MGSEREIDIESGPLRPLCEHVGLGPDQAVRLWKLCALHDNGAESESHHDVDRLAAALFKRFGSSMSTSWLALAGHRRATWRRHAESILAELGWPSLESSAA